MVEGASRCAAHCLLNQLQPVSTDVRPPAPWKLSSMEVAPEVADTPVTATGVPLRAGAWAVGVASLPMYSAQRVMERVG